MENRLCSRQVGRILRRIVGRDKGEHGPVHIVQKSSRPPVLTRPFLLPALRDLPVDHVLEDAAVALRVDLGRAHGNGVDGLGEIPKGQ